MELTATSTDHVHITVTPPAGVDITGTPPRIAILPTSTRGNPGPSDWMTGEWTDGTTARLLVGPDGGAVTLTAGDYRVYINFDPPGAENIVRKAGILTIT